MESGGDADQAQNAIKRLTTYKHTDQSQCNDRLGMYFKGAVLIKWGGFIHCSIPNIC
jgi:hypothetical protein